MIFLKQLSDQEIYYFWGNTKKNLLQDSWSGHLVDAESLNNQEVKTTSNATYKTQDKEDIPEANNESHIQISILTEKE